MSKALIGVPPGVGDVYWCVAALASFKQKFGIEHATLAVQKTSKDRAIEWATMCDFVDDARYVSFQPSSAALKFGFDQRPEPRALDYVLWPNAVLDRGHRIETWMSNRGVDVDLSFKVKTAPPPLDLVGRVVMLASSRETNAAWLPTVTPAWWRDVAISVRGKYGQAPVLIGASWDVDYGTHLRGCTTPIIGQTTLAQVAGILERAELVIGVASGMTILANHFGVPTVALFPDKHHKDFPRSWTRPGIPYTPIFHRDIPTPAELVTNAPELYTRRTG